MNYSEYEQPQASYPALPPPIQEKKKCEHRFVDATSFGSPYLLRICVWCGERRKERRW
jgi:hypothetical protein